MPFPIQDEFWTNVLEFMRPYLAGTEKITAPDIFRDEVGACPFFPYTTLRFVKPDLNWAVLHKGMLDDIEPSFLQNLISSLKPVFANEVFVVFSSHPDLAALNPQTSHLASFIALAKRHRSCGSRENETYWNGLPIGRKKKSRIRAFVRDAVLPRLSLSLRQGAAGGELLRSQVDLYQHGVQSPIFYSSLSTIAATARAATQTCYVGENTALCRVLGKYLMYVDAQDTGIAPHLMMDGYWEIWNSVVIRNQLRKGMYCIDVGANHGYYSLIMAGMVGPSGRVASVEPHPHILALLEKTLDVNGFLDNPVTIVPKAAGAISGEKLRLLTINNKSMNASVRQDLTGEAGTAVCETISISLDDLTADWPRVDLIKIDAEGAEEAIWEGMQHLVSRNPSLITIMEINCARYGNPRGFLAKIEKKYRLRHIDFDSRIMDLDVEECIREKPATDRMLYLARDY